MKLSIPINRHFIWGQSLWCPPAQTQKGTQDRCPVPNRLMPVEMRVTNRHAPVMFVDLPANTYISTNIILNIQTNNAEPDLWGQETMTEASHQQRQEPPTKPFQFLPREAAMLARSWG